MKISGILFFYVTYFYYIYSITIKHNKMENQNKPDWLIKAEEEMAKFANTKVGKMSQKEFEFHERQSNAGKVAGNKAKDSGQFKQFAIEGGKATGSIQGKKNVESGHLASITAVKGSVEAKRRGKLNSLAQKESVKNGNHNTQKIHVCNICGQTGKGPAFLAKHNNKCIIIDIVNLLPNDTFKMGDGIKLAISISNFTYTQVKFVIKNNNFFQFIPIGITGKKGLYKKIIK